jgi:hypothetical protein
MYIRSANNNTASIVECGTKKMLENTTYQELNTFYIHQKFFGRSELDRALWRTRSGTGYEPVAKQAMQ